jgi:hypothetical protein
MVRMINKLHVIVVKDANLSLKEVVTHVACLNIFSDTIDIFSFQKLPEMGSYFIL